MIHIVIPVLNRWHFTEACLKSIASQTYREFKVVVVDHGSTDGTRQKLKEHFPDVILLFGDESMWWAAATNEGVRYALQNGNSDDFILTLNNDLVVKEDYLHELYSYAIARKTTLIGSMCVDIDNESKICFAGVRWNSFSAKYSPAINNDSKNVIVSDLLPGRGTLIPFKAFKIIGLYNELNFPHYAADEDFSLRCRRAGFKLVVLKSAVVMSHINNACDYHGGSFLSGLKINMFSRRSPNNLRRRWLWARRNTRIPVVYFLFDFFRIMSGYFKRSL